MNLEDIEKVLSGEASFRIKQVKQAVFKNFCESWDEVSALPKPLREKLSQKIPLELKVSSHDSDSSTEKVALKFGNDVVEAVLMKHGKRNTVCVSSQVGCALGCDFCATGAMGFRRNLSAFEIVLQVLFFSRILKKKDLAVTNVVFMGMGEPFLNYNQVIEAIHILNDEEMFNIGARRISVSTVGIIEGIKKLSREKLQINLALSLHAPNDKLRSELIPANKKHSIKKILQTVRDYIETTNRKVMIEYVMLDSVNDSEKQAGELVDLLRNSLPPLFIVNLILYNKTGRYQPSTKAKTRRFKHILERKGIEVVERSRFGRDIKAACGQLAGEKQKNC